MSAEVLENGAFAICKHTIRAREIKELIAPLGAEIKCGRSEIGEIYKENDKYFVRFDKIILEDGRELNEIHSGNINAFKMPLNTPKFSFLRECVSAI